MKAFFGPTVPLRFEILVAINTESTTQVELSNILQNKMLAAAGYSTTVFSLEQMHGLSLTNFHIVVSLVELSKPLLFTLTSEKF